MSQCSMTNSYSTITFKDIPENIANGIKYQFCIIWYSCIMKTLKYEQTFMKVTIIWQMAPLQEANQSPHIVMKILYSLLKT